LISGPLCLSPNVKCLDLTPMISPTFVIRYGKISAFQFSLF